MDINHNRRSVDEVQAQNDRLSQDVQTLGRTVAQLAATVDELLTILVERGALDDASTRSRLAAVIRPKVVAAPPNAAASATAKPQAMVRCVKCGTAIPLAYSNMTEHGATCDRSV